MQLFQLRRNHFLFGITALWSSSAAGWVATSATSCYHLWSLKATGLPYVDGRGFEHNSHNSLGNQTVANCELMNSDARVFGCGRVACWRCHGRWRVAQHWFVGRWCRKTVVSLGEHSNANANFCSIIYMCKNQFWSLFHEVLLCFSPRTFLDHINHILSIILHKIVLYWVYWPAFWKHKIHTLPFFGLWTEENNPCFIDA